MTTIEQILIARDGLTPAQARNELKRGIARCRRLLRENSPEITELMSALYGLEFEYLDELITLAHKKP